MKYESSITYHSIAMANVKVFADKQTDKQTDGQTDGPKTYMSVMYPLKNCVIYTIIFIPLNGII